MGARILPEETVAVAIDIQERLYPHIDQHELLEHNGVILIRGLQTLGIPLIVTEQYTKGLGRTIAPYREVIADYQPIEKMTFSCCGVAPFLEKLKDYNRQKIIIFGIEAHVCVLQTTLDLLDNGYIPVVIADCVSSRKNPDKEIAVQRMRQAGAIISSYESILFELCREAGTDRFKLISKLVK